MYKSTSRFRQSLSKRGKKPTSRTLVASDTSPTSGRARSAGLKKMDEKVAQTIKAAKEGYDARSRAPTLIKRKSLPSD
jgi:hypothetical protein